MDLRTRAAPLDAFALDPAIVHLNHGSFGACPRAVLAEQQRWRDRIEAATMRFFVLDYQAALDAARTRLAQFLGCTEAGLVFVPNATTGVATALDALVPPGADVVTTDHAYAACRNALDRVATARGARVITAHVDPSAGPAYHVEQIVSAITPQTRVLLIDHVTSPTALVLDVPAIVAALRGRPIEIVVDGAHAPGMLDLDLAALDDVAAYTGNLHKWVCAPKGAGFLWVHPRHVSRMRPLVTSHGHGFREAFDWTGTYDPSAILAVPAAIDEVGRLAGGWPAFRARGHALALAMRDVLHGALGGEPMAPATMIGTMAAVPVRLPDNPRAFERGLLERGWEVAIADWPRLGAVYVRVSAHVYNELGEAERLAAHLVDLGARGVSSA